MSRRTQPDTRSATVVSNNQLRAIHVNGKGLDVWLSQLCTSATITTGMGSISELGLTFQDDHDASLFRAGVFQDGQIVSYGHWRGRLKGGPKLTNSRGGPKVAVTAPSLFVERLKEQTGEKNWGTLDVGRWIAQEAIKVGMIAEVQTGLGDKKIVREKGEDENKPSTWDVMTELSTELGAWLFETGRTMVFGKPNWLLRTRPSRRIIPLRWVSNNEMSGGLMAMPEFTSGNLDDQELSVKIIGDEADHTLPGDVVSLSGNLSGGTARTNANGWWLVRDVGLPISNTAPVTLTCIRAKGVTP